LGKARGNDDGVLDAYGRALLQRAKYRARRDNDDGEIDRRTHVRDRFVAFDAVDIGVVRIDRIDLSGIVVLAQHREQPPRNLLEIARGPDQRDAFRREKTVERMRHASIVLSVQGIVIASAAKQSISRHKGRMDCYAVRLNLTPHRSNPSPDALQPFAFAASRTFATSATRNVSPLIKSLPPLT